VQRNKLFTSDPSFVLDPFRELIYLQNMFGKICLQRGFVRLAKMPYSVGMVGGFMQQSLLNLLLFLSNLFGEAYSSSY